MKQYQKLLLGFCLGLVFGLVAYYALPMKDYPFMKQFSEVCQFAGAVFLRTIFMIVIPLLLSALMLGVFELAQGRGLGKIASRSIGYTVALSFCAVMISIVLTNFVQPGKGMEFDKVSLASNASVLKIQGNVAATADKVWFQYIVDLIPQNPVESMTKAFQGEIIAVMVFALIFGYALSLVVKEKDNAFVSFMQTVFDTSVKVVDFAMKVAPYGIFGIVFNTAYKLGAGFLQNVAMYAAVVVVGLLIQQLVVYSVFLKVFGKVSPWKFFNQCREVYVYAFSTASSNATLPVALEAAERVLKIPPKIARFVLTIGASANQNGSALFEGVTVLFLAQVYGIDLSFGSQVLVVLMAMMASIGTAGVPGGALPLVVIVMMQVGIPAEGIGIVLGVDRLLDMCRTTLNVSGDLVIAKLVSASVEQDAQPKS